jgi:hypothetical protein
MDNMDMPDESDDLRFQRREYFLFAMTGIPYFAVIRLLTV